MRYKLILAIVLLGLSTLSCEKELIEEERLIDTPEAGFIDRDGVIILHDESVSYYNVRSNKIFGGLFEHINGRKLEQKLLSLEVDDEFDSDYFLSTPPSQIDSLYLFHGKMGIIAIPEANKLEFINPNNMNSLGSLVLSDPTN